MPPRHFWWLVETLDEGGNAKRKAGLSDQDKAQLMRLLHDAQKGKL